MDNGPPGSSALFALKLVDQEPNHDLDLALILNRLMVVHSAMDLTLMQ